MRPTILLFLLLLAATTAVAQETPTAVIDTLVVSTSQVSIEEVLEKIAQRMADDDRAMQAMSYTMLSTTVIRDEPYPESLNYTFQEVAMRFEQDRITGERYVKMWERNREYVDGLLKEDKTDTDIEADWADSGEQALESLPFTEGSSRKYRYEILDRRQVGNSLIYKVSFEPKSKFDALPAGVIWVDYSNWVIRKVDAHMTGTMPYPLFLESMPILRFSQERVGGYWFMTDMQILINLRKVPLVPMPDNVELRVELRDIVINGQKSTPENAVPEPIVTPLPGGDILPEPDGFWLSPEASQDSLDTYWGGIDNQWEEDLSPELEPISLEPFAIDSLTTVGDEELTELRKASWRFDARPVQVPGYNRVQGFSLFAGARIDRPGPHKPQLDVRGGYGFSNKRWLFDAKFDLPLIVSRGPGRVTGVNRRKLSLTITGTKMAALFAGDNRRHERSLSSFFYGSDPNSYFEHRGMGTVFTGRPAMGWKLWAGGGWYQQRRLEQRTSWNLFNQPLSPDGNIEADALNERRLWGGVSWTHGIFELDGSVAWRRATDAAFLGAPRGGDFLQLGGGAKVDVLDGLGNQWVVKGRIQDLGRAGGTDFGAAGPVQWKTWLGDHGTLRGYQAGELTGDGGAWASLDFRPNWDLFAAMRFPILKKWGLQPHLFGDVGRTWDNTGPDSIGPDEGARGNRADLGFGFGRRMDLPGLGEFKNLRMHVAHPVGEGSEGKGWRVLLAFEK